MGVFAEQATNLDLARAGDSGTKTLTGGEDTLYDETHTSAFMFDGGSVDLSDQAAGDTVIIKMYKTIKSGGTPRQFSDDTTYTFVGVQSSELVHIGGNIPNLYGLKITITHSVVAAAFDVDHEWFDRKR